MHLTFILGTRPEIIKTAPVIKAARRRRIQVSVIHTGQHHTPEMNDVFYRQFCLQRPDVVLKPGTRKGRAAFLKNTQSTAAWHLRRMKPDMVLVQGDTDSVVAGALAARDCGIPVGHIEAGLRSYDNRSIEEKNRIRVDRISSLLFCPTAIALTNLEREKNVKGRIFLTGNSVADLYKRYRSDIGADGVLRILDLKRNRYALLTIHRRETTGTGRNLENILDAVSAMGLRVVFPVHPRTLDRLERSNLMSSLPSNLDLVSPLPYVPFISLLKDACLVLTDSGGVQEEACLLHTPCVTLRDYTERPETVLLGVNRLTGYSPVRIREAVKDIMHTHSVQKRLISPYGPGDAAEKIITAIKSSLSL